MSHILVVAVALLLSPLVVVYAAEQSAEIIVESDQTLFRLYDLID